MSTDGQEHKSEVWAPSGMLTSFYELCVAYINPKWWSCRPKIIWIVSDDLVGTLMGHIFLQNTWLRALLRLLRCTAAGNKGLSCWARLRLLRLLTVDIWSGGDIPKEAIIISLQVSHWIRSKNDRNRNSCCFRPPWWWCVGVCVLKVLVSTFFCHATSELWVWGLNQYPALRLRHASSLWLT